MTSSDDDNNELNFEEDFTEDKNSRMTTGMFSSRTEEWGTPQYVFDDLHKIFDFTLDVCATSQNAKCKKYFTKKEDGLSKNWFGERCWMNPPYGKEIGAWMKKASEAETLVVCLVHARTDTRWFHQYGMKADEIWFVKGRLKFGDGKQSAPFPSCIIIYRNTFERQNIYTVPIIKTIEFGKKSVRTDKRFGSAVLFEK